MKKNSRWGKSSKSKDSSRKKKNNIQKLNKPKGILLERIVAAFYDIPGAKIERNVKLFPASGDRSREREIDVLITAQIAGMEVRFAIQCKNEKSPIDIDKMDSFVGALKDVGIPAQNGIFVSVNGFASGALSRAKEEGIRTFVVKGLTKDRLRSETIAAVQHSVFLIPRVIEASLRNSLSEIKYPDHPALFSDENKRPVGTIADLILGKWLNGDLPPQLGEYELEMEVPEGWFQFFEGKKEMPQKITAKVQVLGLVITTPGGAENHLLIDAETQNLEKFNTHVEFKNFKEGQTIPLEIFVTEENLKQFIETSGDIRLSIRTQLHRIIYNNLYYPYSEPIVKKLYEQVQKYGEDFSSDTQELIQKELWEISQNDLFSKAELGIGGMFLPVITVNDDGELTDVTLLFKNKEYDKIIALESRYEKNPFKPFSDLIALSYLEKSKMLFKKAQSKDGQTKTRLIEESLSKVNRALSVDPRMIDAVDHFSNLMLYKENYPASLHALNYIISREPENYRAWANQSLVLRYLNKFDEALKSLNKAVKFAEAQNLEADKIWIIYLCRAIILHNQNQNFKAWKDILKAWQLDPIGTVQDISSHHMIIEVVKVTNKIEGHLLHLEILLFAATQIFKAGDREQATNISDDALRVLEGIMPLDKVKNVIAKGVLDSNLMEGMLNRSAKRLFETGEKDWVNERVSRIQVWAKNNFHSEESFLDEFKIL